MRCEGYGRRRISIGLQNEALAGYEAPTDDEVEVNPEVKEEEDDEVR